MRIGLSMVLKNEAKNLESCLGPIHSLFDQIVVVDTGSTDESIELLQRNYGITTLSHKNEGDDPESITSARNLSLLENNADWIFILDGDEQISPQDLLRLKTALNTSDSGYFITWRNTREGSTFDDYKLAAVRNRQNVKFEGHVHSNLQPSFRSLGLSAKMLEGVVINHSLDSQKSHRTSRIPRLKQHIANEPNWWRYQWFLGYAQYREKNFEEAVPLLRDTCNSLSTQFPVECLNAHIVLTDINARKGIHDKCFRIIRQAVSFYETVKDDFEVVVNKDLKDWLYAAKALINENRLDDIHAYQFGC